MFYLLHGNDEFTSREQLKKLLQQGSFEYNQDTYSGAEVDFTTITTTCNTFPFLSEQRLVVVEGLPKKRRGEESEAGARTGEPSTTTTPTPGEVGEVAGKGSKSKKGKKGGKTAITG